MDWMCTVNLKDAYLSVPIAEKHRKFLRFVWEGTTFDLSIIRTMQCTEGSQKTAEARHGLPAFLGSANSNLLGQYPHTG